MTRQHPLFIATSLWACIGLLLWTFASPAVEAADLGYPPPPGAYRSEPSVWSEMPRSSTGDRQTGPDHSRVTPSAGSSSMLPLPDEGYDGRPGSYDANNLFGAVPTVEKAPPAFVEPARHPQADEPVSPRSPAPAYPAAPPQHNDFSMDFRRSDRQPAVTNGYQQPDAWSYQGYPAYAPAYPTYQQYPDPYHPGQAGSYAPAPPAQAYPDYDTGDYAAADPQAGDRMPPQDRFRGIAPAVPEYPGTDGYTQGQDPTSAAFGYPDTDDSTVFRPAD